MVSVGILATMKAQPGKEQVLEAFLKNAVEVANEERGTTVWFAFRVNPTTFGIFDAFGSESDRDVHLAGEIASALMENAPLLLIEPPNIEKIDILANKIPQ